MSKKRKKKGREVYFRDWRKHAGLTQAQLADRLGVAQGTISDLETGNIAYTQAMLEAVADALNCQPWDLIWRPPGAEDRIRSVLAGMDPTEEKRALAILKALRDEKAA